MGGPDFLHPGPQPEQVVVIGGGVILARDVRHDHEQAFFLELPIGPAAGPQHLGAAHFKVGEVVGVVQPPLTIGFLIPHPYFDLVHRFGHDHIPEGDSCEGCRRLRSRPTPGVR